MTAARPPPAEQRRRRVGDTPLHVRSKLTSLPSSSATTAIGVTALFVAISCWWLAHNRAMPFGDAGFHIVTALDFHEAIAAGHWTEPLTWNGDVYPPLTPLVGALGFFLLGRDPAGPVLVENLIYVPLLALACYQVARRVYGSLAGCLAVVFALGAPLIAEQFHVFMLDAPLTALVAATVWLVLASDRFERVPIAAGAGAIAGLGVMSKQTFPLYVVGFILLVLIRDRGYRNLRGLGAFSAAVLIVATPWYVTHIGEIHQVLRDARSEATIPPLARPPLLSGANFSWYFWALANGVLFTPLLAFAATGFVTATVLAARRRMTHQGSVELLGGLALAFAAITAMPHKDVRYAMPLMVYLAVLGTAWIARLRPALRSIALAALAIAVAASTMGASFGVGHTYSGMLPGNWLAPLGQGVMPMNRFTIYANHDYMVSGPRRAGDLLGLFRQLRDAGVRRLSIAEAAAPPEEQDFNANGLRLFMRLTGLGGSSPSDSRSVLGHRIATLIRGRDSGSAPPCVRLPNGDGVWIRLGDPVARGARDYCPRFTQQFYGP